MADQRIVISLEAEGSCPADGGRQASGGAARVPRTGGNYNSPAWTNVSRRSQSEARESILAKQLTRIPYVSRDQAARFAYGVRAGLRLPDVERASQFGLRHAGRAGAYGGRVGSAIGIGTRALGLGGVTMGAVGAVTAGAAAGAAAGLAAVAASAALVVRAYNRQQAAMQRVQDTIAGTGLLELIQQREALRLQLARIQRSQEIYGDLSGLMSRQTDRQMSMERFQANFEMFIARALEPVAQFVADLAEIFSNIDLGELAADLKRALSAAMALMSPATYIAFELVMNWLEDLVQQTNAIANLLRQLEARGEMDPWSDALDPFAEENLPYAPDSELGKIYNPQPVN